MPIQHRRHLSRDLARCQVALDAQLRRQAELTVHRTTHLARHTNRRPLVALPPRAVIAGVMERSRGHPVLAPAHLRRRLHWILRIPSLPLLLRRGFAPIATLATITTRH